MADDTELQLKKAKRVIRVLVVLVVVLALAAGFLWTRERKRGEQVGQVVQVEQVSTGGSDFE